MSPLYHPLHLITKSILPLVLLCGLAGCGEKRLANPDAVVPISLPAAREISGLASSHLSDDLLWIHNDSGSPPLLYAITPKGLPAGTVKVKGVKNIDWEDISTFDLDGQSWILIADSGDNRGIRKNCSFIIVKEPSRADLSLANELVVPVAWRVPFTYPDGPHDCEAAAVDSKAGQIILVTKRTKPPVVYVVPLRLPAGATTCVAEKVAELTDIPQPSTIQRIIPSSLGRYRAQPTGLDFAPDQSRAAVLTYGQVLLYARRPGEGWAAAFSRSPEIFATNEIAQAEAICFSRDGRSIYVSGEASAPHLVRYKAPPKQIE